MNESQIKSIITSGQTALGIEFGSTRIKAVLIGPDHTPLASGGHGWENQLVNGIWTYSMEAIHFGLQDAYANLVKDVQEKYGVELETIGYIGISAMMHGYLPFDGDDNLLTPFRTWRNTITERSSIELTELLEQNIPQRWTIAHLDHAILGGEDHIAQIRYLTTLEGYIHWKLTGLKVIGIGEAAGIFPIDSATFNYDVAKVQRYNDRIAGYNLPWKLEDILPKPLLAGENAGYLTEEGAKMLDPTGKLKPGIPLCPPEGDVGTGIIATNSVTPRTGNVSAGTSVFSMITLERPLKNVRMEITPIMTPTGSPVAMVHCNNCTTDINAWAGLFKQFVEACGMELDTNTLYTTLFKAALDGDKDCGGLVSYNYDASEPVTNMAEGRPLFARKPGEPLTLANFARTLLMTALSSLKVGMDLLREENVQIDTLYGHGGYFKTPGVGQRLLAAAVKAPVTVMETAGEGGAWGMALLASYAMRREAGETLEAYLANRVFAGMVGTTMEPDPEDVAGFDAYAAKFRKGLAVERAATENL